MCKSKFLLPFLVCSQQRLHLFPNHCHPLVALLLIGASVRIIVIAGTCGARRFSRVGKLSSMCVFGCHVSHSKLHLFDVQEHTSKIYGELWSVVAPQYNVDTARRGYRVCNPLTIIAMCLDLFSVILTRKHAIRQVYVIHGI
jgi:hypothetical protein